jgi:SAM-dependent MidA family methyltransferase
MSSPGAESLSARLAERLHAAIARAGGWLSFDRFMAGALYEPGLGYYARGTPVFGTLPQQGSDFVTAPELSPLFGRTLARQVAQALDAAGADTVYEFGAGSGALAAQLLGELGQRVRHYRIVDVSGTLRERQAERLAAWGEQVQWLDAWPDTMHGVVLGNEVLDAMPVQLLHFDGAAWFERGVVSAPRAGPARPASRGGSSCPAEPDQLERAGAAFAWADRPTALRTPVPLAPGTVTEIHTQAEAFIRTLAQRLQRGAAFFIDYGFPEAEYYHPQRLGGTLMCHRAHVADTDPLESVGEKDITAHVNFSGIALTAQDAGLDVLGYTSQARFLLNGGLLQLLEGADLRSTAMAQKLITEHEMGELFKVICLARGIELDPVGFTAGDRSHTL